MASMSLKMRREMHNNGKSLSEGREQNRSIAICTLEEERSPEAPSARLPRFDRAGPEPCEKRKCEAQPPKTPRWLARLQKPDWSTGVVAWVYLAWVWTALPFPVKVYIFVLHRPTEVIMSSKEPV